MSNTTQLHASDMVYGYLDAALWAGLNWGDDESAEPQHWDETHGRYDISAEATEQALALCLEFAQDNMADLSIYFPGSTPEQWGHDLYLTRNGHGAGFWDRGGDDTQRAAGRRLSEAAKVYGDADFFINEFGQLDWQ